MNKSGYAGNLISTTVVIPNGQTTSAAFDIGGFTLVGMILPSALTSTAMKINASDSLAGTYVPVYGPTGTQISYTVAASRYVVIPPTDLQGVNFIELVAGSAEGADRTITLILKGQ